MPVQFQLVGQSFPMFSPPIGSHTSTLRRLAPVKPRGAMPTIVIWRPARVIVRPTIDESPPNAPDHNPYPSTPTAAACSGRSSVAS